MVFVFSFVYLIRRFELFSEVTSLLPLCELIQDEKNSFLQITI